MSTLVNQSESLPWDEFYLYDGAHPVAIESLVGDDQAVVRFIERTNPERIETVPIAKLEVLTRETAEDSIKRINGVIAKCNMRIHAFNECLRYMG